MINLKVYNRKKISIIILDNFKSEEIRYCIPNSKSSIRVSVHGTINIIFSFNFFFNFFIFLIKTKKIFIANLISFCIEKQTKILISFSDNSPLIGQINDYLPQIHAIAVQNGTRSKYTFHGWKRILNFPNLYGFGQYEKDLLDEMKKKYVSYKSVGSLRYGIYKKEILKKYELLYNNEVCYISHWKNNIWNGKYYRDPDFLKYLNERMYINLPIIYKSLASNLIPFKIILRSEDKNDVEKEKLFYQKILKSKKINFYENKTFLNSYLHCDQCKLIVTFASTLGFEMYGNGNRVLFLGSDKHLTRNGGYPFSQCFNKMPEKIKIINGSKTEILSKLHGLYNLEAHEFDNISKASRKYYMSYQEKFAHEIIRDDINKVK